MIGLRDVPVCIALALLSALASSSADSPSSSSSSPEGALSTSLKSFKLASAVRHVAWLGSSNLTCDAKCRDGCLGLGAAGHSAGAWHGDAINQQLDFCLAACSCAGGADRVLVTTESGSAHLSTDGGSSWKELVKLLPAEAVREAGSFRAEQLRTSHAAPQRVVVLTNTTTAWMSSDGGEKWQAVRLTSGEVKKQRPQRVAWWKWHPSEKDWALAGVLPPRGPPSAAASAGVVAGGRQRHRSTVFYTQDAGKTWKVLSADVEQCQWAVKPGGDKRRILLARYQIATGSSRDSSLLEVLATTDFMASHTMLIGDGVSAGNPVAAARAHIHGDFIAAAAPDATTASGGSSGRLQLWLGVDSGEKTPRFQAAEWPANMGPVRSRQLKHLQVLYTAEHMTLLFVPAAEGELPWGHVFRFSPATLELEPLLTDVHHTSAGLAWQPVGGIEGAFMANRAVLDQGQDLDKAERRFNAQAEAASEDRTEDDDGGEVAGASGSGEGSGGEAENERYAVRTYISVNMGLAWQPLRAPLPSEGGAAARALPAECSKQGAAKSPCSLHLARWTSASAAPGIILGVGNVGVRLSENPEHHSVFLSRDAGLTWKAVLEGPHMVSILGHGDALVAVPLRKPNKVFYAVDGGSSWSSSPLGSSGGNGAADGESPAAVRGLFTHPSHTDLRGFVALGSDASPSMTVTPLSLAGALTAGSCKLPDDPSNSGSDFERWSPADALEDAHASKRPVCLLGARTQYVRRKPGRSCRTGALKPAPLDLRADTPCECTAADWACDTGFHRASYSSKATCEPLEDTLQPNVSALCAATTEGHVLVTRGYVKSPGNRCSGGVDLSPRPEPCPGNTGLAGVLKGLFERFKSIRITLCIVSIIGLIALYHFKGPSPSGACMMTAKLRRFSSHAKQDEFIEDDEEREFLLPGRNS